MNAGTFLKVLKQVIAALENDGILKSDGTFTWPDSAQPYAVLAGQVESALKANGVTVPSEIDKVLAALPLILMVAGVQ